MSREEGGKERPKAGGGRGRASSKRDDLVRLLDELEKPLHAPYLGPLYHLLPTQLVGLDAGASEVDGRPPLYKLLQLTGQVGPPPGRLHPLAYEMDIDLGPGEEDGKGRSRPRP